MLGAGLDDGGTKWHSHRQFQNLSLTGIDDRFLHKRFGPQFCSAVCDLGFNESTRNGERRVKTTIVRFRIRLVENRFERFQKNRQGQSGKRVQPSRG